MKQPMEERHLSYVIWFMQDLVDPESICGACRIIRKSENLPAVCDGCETPNLEHWIPGEDAPVLMN